MSNLGIAYSKQLMQDILRPENYREDNPDFELIGFAFAKNSLSLEQLRAVSLVRNTNVEYEKNMLDVFAILYKYQAHEFTFDRIDIVSNEDRLGVRGSFFVYEEAETSFLVPRQDNPQNASPEELWEIDFDPLGNFQDFVNLQNQGFNDQYEFWSDKQGFALFTVKQLETILHYASYIIISGAEINFGKGVKPYGFKSGFVNDQIAYPTFKAESDIISSNRERRSDPYVFDVALGLPCPPIWGDDGYTSVLNNAILEMLFRNYKYDLANPKILNPHLKDRFANESKTLRKNWNHLAYKLLEEINFDKKYLYALKKYL